MIYRIKNTGGTKNVDMCYFHDYLPSLAPLETKGTTTWVSEEAFCFGCSEYRSRSLSSWRCFGITERTCTSSGERPGKCRPSPPVPELRCDPRSRSLPNRRRVVSEQPQDYDQRAEEYQRQANAVADPWLKKRYLTLAKRCREMQKAPQGEEGRPRGVRIAR